ncbi:MAG: LLM class flavin-dependent oxidoreductase [Candidatus Limnocylindria bacterium]
MTDAVASLRFAIYTPNFGVFAEPSFAARTARIAEDAGWDGWFIWDNLAWETELPFADPWVTLAAVAACTTRIRIGPLVTPLPRRRPWTVARACVTLDRLSAGRLVLGAGLGGDWYRELSAFGEELDARRRAAMLDEGLELVTGLWSGEEVTFEGQHYRVERVRFLPSPVQQPRIPIWIASVWPSRRSLQRAARWDGVVTIGETENLDPGQVAELVLAVTTERQDAGRHGPFEVAVPARSGGLRPEARRAKVVAVANAGATWWLEALDPTMSADEVEALVSAGPPTSD